MKTSLICIALLLNTTMLLAELLFIVIKEVNPLVFAKMGGTLLLVYPANKILDEFFKALENNFNPLEIVVKKKKKIIRLD